jgi:transcription antitermination factor NusG
MVSFNGEPARIPDHQIEAVRRILEIGCAAQPYPYLARGDKVEITSSPLKGLTGYIIESRRNNRFIISIDEIRQSLAIEIDCKYLKRITKKSSELSNSIN